MCIISPLNNFDEIVEKILQKLHAKSVEISFNEQNLNRFNRLQQFFDISNNQINVVLNSYNFERLDDDIKNNNLDQLFLGLNDLICEKMTLLSLEKK